MPKPNYATNKVRKGPFLATGAGKGIRETYGSKFYDGPGSVVCPDCGCPTKALVSGRPVSHAYMGYSVSLKNGRPACFSSGNLIAGYNAKIQPASV